MAICFWHAFFAVLYPILIVEFLWPNAAREPWLPRNATWALAVISLGSAIPVFFFGSPVSQFSRNQSDALWDLKHIVFIVAASGILGYLAHRSPRIPDVTSRTARPKIGWILFLCGGAAYALVMPVPFCFAAANLPWTIVVAYIAALAIIGISAATRWREATREELFLLVCGGETAQSVFGIWLGLQSGRWLFLGVTCLFAVGFAVAALTVQCRAATRLKTSCQLMQDV
jgi:hypothetical protein